MCYQPIACILNKKQISSRIGAGNCTARELGGAETQLVPTLSIDHASSIINHIK